ncbi:predicted protein [Naegleria gruberi]|uniref:Predicted protein n=1 Tax=Naegleria gruberi TaxID=5762 RepID=D2V714_NAEGR|nr:uncharacterized protein NAEGRDRAFT_64634 [Naegleria gruberi]EFC47179.1 predicted protein [Naegleria gruberi]|eukprot:XP_002679923.1 predicted protein [Naegleria gruberi strain NEG-M]
MSSSLDMEKLLNESWRTTNLPEIIKKQKDAEKFIGTTRSKDVIPKLENTFRALNDMKSVSDCKVVIFGQDPYPREESAIGVAFYDGQIKKWSDAMSPSFRNIIKNVLISADELKTSDKVEALRSKIEKLKLLPPPQWFEDTMSQNVLWLNTALTFSGKEKTDLDKHTKFWKPIIEGILQVVLKATEKGIVFVLWGGIAKKLKTTINNIAKKEGKTVKFVEANHPAVESFHDVNSFSDINKHLKELGHEEIDWLPTSKKRKQEESKTTTTSSSSDNDESSLKKQKK